MSTIQKQIEIKNRKASFEFSFLEKYIAGMVLLGSEIKSIRQGKANLSDAYCVFVKGELWIRNLHINEYEKATHYTHVPLRERKLLLTANELKKLEKKLKDQGLTIIPTKLFINEKGFAKLEIALAKGKKIYDKREDIKKKDTQRELQRKLK
ncbi:MAG: SsrA-binding protein SmpB [Bacteroidia bacterium]|nr:SsrA-binding protein SmpB [Bacteroidia bacterium]